VVLEVFGRHHRHRQHLRVARPRQRMAAVP